MKRLRAVKVDKYLNFVLSLVFVGLVILTLYTGLFVHSYRTCITTEGGVAYKYQLGDGLERYCIYKGKRYFPKRLEFDYNNWKNLSIHELSFKYPEDLFSLKTGEDEVFMYGSMNKYLMAYLCNRLGLSVKYFCRTEVFRIKLEQISGDMPTLQDTQVQSVRDIQSPYGPLQMRAFIMVNPFIEGPVGYFVNHEVETYAIGKSDEGYFKLHIATRPENLWPYLADEALRYDFSYKKVNILLEQYFNDVSALIYSSISLK